jgi:hypothetical protein
MYAAEEVVCIVLIVNIRSITGRDEDEWQET